MNYNKLDNVASLERLGRIDIGSLHKWYYLQQYSFKKLVTYIFDFVFVDADGANKTPLGGNATLYSLVSIFAIFGNKNPNNFSRKLVGNKNSIIEAMAVSSIAFIIFM